MPTSVYLAGPDVFAAEQEEIFRTRKRICREHGLEPLAPLDNGASTAQDIYRGNVHMIDRCAAVIANVTPFRGPHCDAGTAWEIGYAIARGVPVFAWSEDPRSLADRVPEGPAGGGRDAEGMSIEDFGLSENLMIAECIAGGSVHASFAAAAAAAAAHLLGRDSSF
jgi:nucleoside 2-deoxyribosyltransferase